jgi:oligopeptide/dipeptide ABC transporter ATP-binding protein
MTVRDLVAEPLRIHTNVGSEERLRRVNELLHRVGINPDHGDRYPREFSGGQRQRIAIARSLVVEPDVLICDEPTSSLDVSTQGQIAGLLRELQREHGIAYLFITHDLRLARLMAHRIAVMYRGRIVELAASTELYETPLHPYTLALLSAQPRLDRQSGPTPTRVRTQRSTPTDPPNSGCQFAPRCPAAMTICIEQPPPAFVADTGRHAECFLHTEGPKLGGASIAPLLEDVGT